MNVFLVWPINKIWKEFQRGSLLSSPLIMLLEREWFLWELVVEKKERDLNGSTMHKYMKPKIPFPVFDRLVSWVQHSFTCNGICVLISPSLPPASDTGPEEWNSCPAQQFGREESLLGAVWGNNERQGFGFLWSLDRLCIYCRWVV